MGNTNIKELKQKAKETGVFDLNNLEITEIPRLPKFKLDFSKITKFTAEDNKLTTVLNKDLELLVNLVDLNLSKNHITRFSMPSLPQLTKLDLGFNPLVELDDNLENAPKLASMTCYGCSLRTVPENSLKKMPHLSIIVNSNYLSIGHEFIPIEIVPQLLGINDQKVPSEIVSDFLYLGSVNAAQNWEALKERKITDVLCMVSMHQLPFPDKLKYKHVKIDDIETADIKQHFEDMNNYLEEIKRTGGRVLVHCAAGVSRSGSAVVAYIMATQKLTYAEALAFVSQRRPCVCPNPGFERQLVEYENVIRAIP